MSLTGSRNYDGTTNAASSILAVSNAIAGDTVSVASGSGTLAGKDVGTWSLTSLGSLALGNNAKGDYTLTGATGSVTINAAPLDITANGDSKVYGQVKTYGAGSTGFTTGAGQLQNNETIGSVTITDTNGGGLATAPAGGTYALTPSAATGGTFSISNYKVTYHAGTLTVNPSATTTILSLPNNPAVPGQSVTFTAVIAAVRRRRHADWHSDLHERLDHVGARPGCERPGELDDLVLDCRLVGHGGHLHEPGRQLHRQLGLEDPDGPRARRLRQLRHHALHRRRQHHLGQRVAHTGSASTPTGPPAWQ